MKSYSFAIPLACSMAAAFVLISHVPRNVRLHANVSPSPTVQVLRFFSVPRRQLVDSDNFVERLGVASPFGSRKPAHAFHLSTTPAAVFILGTLGICAGYAVACIWPIKSKAFLEWMPMASAVALYDMKDPAEALTMWKKEGYTILDVRSEMERSEGRIRGVYKVAEIPLITANTQYDPDAGKVIMLQEANPEWLDVVKTRFPRANAKLLVMCSDGNNRTKQAVDLLAAEGYCNVVGMSGGYNRWDQLFDRQQRPREKQAQTDRSGRLYDPTQWITWRGTSNVNLQKTAVSAASWPPAARAAGIAGQQAATARTMFPVVEYAVYHDPAFQAATVAAFPAKGNATVEEARVLWKLDGYTILDVRSDMEGQEGRIQGPNKQSVDIPMFQASASYDAIQGAKVFNQQPNFQWLQQVKERFPYKDAKIIVTCSDGTNRSTQALQALSAAGYTNLVRMVGGYNRWNQVFDRTLNLRSAQEQIAKVDWLEDHIQWDRFDRASGGGTGPMSFQAALETASRGPLVAMGLYQDPTFQRATIAAFPAKGNASIEEARVIWKLDGYTLVDIRTDMEGRESGRIRGPNKRSVDVPMFQAKTEFDDRYGKKVVIQIPNTKWLQQMKELFPLDCKLLIMCSDGTNRSSQAIDILRAEGYTTLVRMSGGYNAWDQVFDSRLALRTPEQQAAKASWLADPVPWMKWAASVGDKAASPLPSQRPTSALPENARPPQGVQAGRGTPVAPFQDPIFQQATIAAFPMKRYANVDESRVLWKVDDYALVDIRSDWEGVDGRVRGPNKGSIDIPLYQAMATLDSSTGQRVVTPKSNPQWLQQMRERFSPDTKILLMCSDGTSRSEQALEILTAAGYRNVAVMAGGYRKWDQVFDSRLAIRPLDAQARKAQDLRDPVQWRGW